VRHAEFHPCFLARIDRHFLFCIGRVLCVNQNPMPHEDGYRSTYEAVVDGIPIRFQETFYTQKRRKIGQTVTVRYESKNPENFSVRGTHPALLFPLVFCFFGLVCCAIGVIMVVSQI
jgi:hypothetical protein